MEEEMSKDEFFYGTQGKPRPEQDTSIRDGWEEQLSSDALDSHERAFISGYEEEAEQRILGET